MTVKQIKTLFSILSIFIVLNISAFEMPDIDLPDGFQINVFTDDVPNARSMTLGDEMIFVSTRSEGKIYAITK